jgi:hypothetical protein
VHKIRLIISTLFLALTFVASAGFMLESGTALSATLSAHVSDVASDSCNGRAPLHEHKHHCHNIARPQTVRIQRVKPKLELVAWPASFVRLTTRRTGDMNAALPAGYVFPPNLSAKTPFLSVFRYKTSLLF